MLETRLKKQSVLWWSRVECRAALCPQDCFLTMSPGWYQSLIKVLLSRFPQSCRHFDENGIQYLVRLGGRGVEDVG